MMAGNPTDTREFESISETSSKVRFLDSMSLPMVLLFKIISWVKVISSVFVYSIA